MTEKMFANTPVCRMVAGSLTEEARPYQGRPKMTKSGEPRTEYFALLAAPKGPAFDEFFAKIWEAAQAAFPAGQAAKPPWDPTNTFSWKIKDGDDPRYAGREGHAGCWLIRASSGYPQERVFDNAVPAQQIDPTVVVPGHYVVMSIGFSGNGDLAKPGMYLNLGMTQLVGYGPAIRGGPSAEQVFGATAAVLPPGASAAPVANAPMPTGPPQPAAPAAAPVPAGPPQPAAPPPIPGTVPPAAAGAPGVPVPPATGWVSPKVPA